MKKLLIFLPLLLLLTSCETAYRIRRDSHIVPSGDRALESRFRLPEQHGNFRFDVVRRLVIQTDEDITYLRVEYVGEHPLMFNSLILVVDNQQYTMRFTEQRQELDREVTTVFGTPTGLHRVREVILFPLSRDILMAMRSSRDRIAITIMGQQQQFGVNLYQGRELERLQESLARLASGY